MLTWYEDKELEICFSEVPDVYIRYPKNFMSEEEKKECISKPFICKNKIEVEITHYRKKNKKKMRFFSFSIPKDYTWDGASIPRPFWRLIGSKQDPRFLIPSMLHDYMCEHHSAIGDDRNLADKIFDKMLKVSLVPPHTRFLMFHSVEFFQRFCGWNKR